MAAVEADEVHLAFPSEVYGDLQEILHPADESHPFAGKFERGAFCVVTRSTGEKRISYLVREVIRPQSSDDLGSAHEQDDIIDRNDRGGIASLFSGSGFLGERGGLGADGPLQFSQEYHHRAIERARELNGGLLRVHTHPGGVHSSAVDRDSAKRVFDQDADRLPPGAPLVAAITNESGEWSARAYEFGADEMSATPATAIRIVGPDFEKRETPDSPLGPAGARGRVDGAQQDSSIQMWGAGGQRILAGLRVGLVGCGGVGSILAEHLPRLGVGELILVDFDHLEPANQNRAQGATPMDVRQRRLKTRVAQRDAHAAATAPDFDTTVIDGSVVEEDPEYTAVPELLDCDVIVEAVDAARPRLVLDHIASTHCIPVISGGSRLYTEASGLLTHESKVEVSATGPGWPCFECQRVWLPKDVEYERDHPRFRGERGYVEGGVNPDEEPRSPSVIGINAMVAGLIQRRLIGVVLGVTSRMVGTVRMNPRDLETNWHSTVACQDGCNRPAIAAGDQHHLPTGTDWSMRYERDDISMPEAKTIDPERAQGLLDRDDEGER